MGRTGVLRPRAAVFDMDGLLLNTESLRMAALADSARETGAPVKTELFAALIGGATPEARKALDAHVRDDLPADFWTVYRRWADRRMADVRPMPGAVELLDYLKSRDIPCAIATSATHGSVEKFCGPHGLADRFKTIVARGDYAQSKPAPDAYLVAAERLGFAPADCLALEDSYNGVRAAVAAGMATVMAPDVLPATDEMRALCVAVVGDLRAVIDIV
ncbi:MAG: HAD family phosphatase [Hyphomicrobiales bacterium]|nr:HAD family phosphatase [Hyphomicrobiales bacterium]